MFVIIGSKLIEIKQSGWGTDTVIAH